MPEPQTVKDRMEAMGWAFDCDINDGELVAAAFKLRSTGPGRAVVTHYHTDQEFRTDLTACMAACDAAEDWP
ncbi:hypothetical protein [Niveispirillum sp.]|uniref:hypothetical protein n=1 Tax=Niveispirillum sp. TaxID=1917217 RepID=UPI001B6D02B7|nr:hypothetical protein [Niveispirillum sp.]MBP7337674.1 hypothetical protein [Niveispirillum sp.]